jgi:ABC-type Zn uptake system ZnuABC Zn-binding protein ZnuA
MNRKSFLTALTVCLVVAAGMSPAVSATSAAKQTVLATTFPIYQIVRNVTKGWDGVNVELMIPSQLGCPHGYALTPQDMQKLAKADILVVNGLGMEEFLGAPVKKANPRINAIDSSAGIKETLQYQGEEHHHSHAEHAHHGAAHRHHGDQPYEWAGAFTLDPGVYTWTFAKVDGQYADPAMKMAYLVSEANDPIEHAENKVAKLFAQKGTNQKHGSSLDTGKLHILQFDAGRDTSEFTIKIDKAGTYVFFTEHMPSEFEAGEHYFKTAAGRDVEPVAQEPEAGHAHHHGEHGHEHGHDHHHGGVNPHLFASPRMTAKLAMNIAAELSKADATGAATYFTNAQAYADTMNTLADDMAALGGRLKNNRIVQPHGVFDYLARDMGLEIVAVMQAHGQEPSAAEMVSLVKTIKEKNAGAIFTEPQYPEKAGKSLAKETGIAVALLDPAATGPENASLTHYEEIMRQNMKTLESTLGIK